MMRNFQHKNYYFFTFLQQSVVRGNSAIRRTFFFLLSSSGFLWHIKFEIIKRLMIQWLFVFYSLFMPFFYFTDWTWNFSMYVFPICMLYIFNIKVILVVSYNSYQKWGNERREFNGAGVSLFINIIKYSSTFCTCWTYSFLSSSAAIFFHDCVNFPWCKFSKISSDCSVDEDFTL